MNKKKKRKKKRSTFCFNYPFFVIQILDGIRARFLKPLIFLNMAGTETKDITKTTIDTSSSYYLHPSDHPGLIFVTHPLSENRDNYFTWRRSLLNALHSKNKAGL